MINKGKHIRLGELLLQAGLINPGQLEKAISIQRQEGGRLGEVLVKLGMVKEDQVVSILAQQLKVPFFSLGTGMLKPALDQGLERLIPHEFALKNFVLPLSRTLRLSLIHISEPTRLLSNSYAVFCLKKKKKTNIAKNTK